MFDYLTDTSTMLTEVISVSQGDLSCPIGFCNFDGDFWINIEFLEKIDNYEKDFAR